MSLGLVLKKKYYKQEVNDEEQKFKLLETLLKKDYSSIVFAGPGNFRGFFEEVCER